MRDPLERFVGGTVLELLDPLVGKKCDAVVDGNSGRFKVGEGERLKLGIGERRKVGKSE